MVRGSADYKPDMTAHNPASADTDVEGFLHLLARAVRQFHTYPETSPLCGEAIDACYRSFVALDRSEWLVLLVTPHEFRLGDSSIGAGTMIEQELVWRLHRAHVASLNFDRSVTPRDLRRLCSDIIRADELAGTKATFAELLADHGVETVVPQMARRPEVLEIGTRPAPVWDLVAREADRRRHATAVGPTQYLYPPEKGWVRLDPTAPAESVSLIDLALLVDNPSDIATMLLRLTDDDPVGPQESERALERKFADVAVLFSALEGPLAQVMFGKLARAVLSIPADRRQDLLTRTILPGLLDGRAADGAVLRSFPDPDLAESLCLLLDLETAAPEIVGAAMNRLELPAERRESVTSLVEARLQADHRQANDVREVDTDRYAKKLIRVDAGDTKSFADFSAFDLSIDGQTSEAIEGVCRTLVGTDLPVTQIECLWRLVHLEPNPTTVDVFLRRTLLLFGDLDRAGRWRDLAVLGARFRSLADELGPGRPDVADVILAGLEAFCTKGRVLGLLDLFESDDEGRDVSTMFIDAFAPALPAPMIAVLDDGSLASRSGVLSTLMSQHASVLAPALVRYLGQGKPPSTRVAVRVCGFAGAGYEDAVAGQLGSGDEQTVREALRALARIGSSRAAALVAAHVERGASATRAAAAEALWHFPPAQRSLQLRQLLGRREFVVQNTPIATRLIERAVQTGVPGELKAVLGNLEGLRFRFWSPALMRVAWKARELREQ